jgi:predicted deacetylase
MNWTNWVSLEATLLKLDIQPILAVVPDNKDPTLIIDQARADFWECVRLWQSRGWTIAIHGFEHRYTNSNAGIIPLNKRSEFAGLPASEQETKLLRAVAVFQREGVVPSAWIAPSHSFDQITTSILRRLGINIISDGFSYYPFLDSSGMTWIPQQLWALTEVRHGIWTVCFHPNSWSSEQVQRELESIAAYRDRIVSLKSVIATNIRNHPSLADRLFWKWGPMSRVSSSPLLRTLLNLIFYTPSHTIRQRLSGRFGNS